MTTLSLNQRNKMNGLSFLDSLPSSLYPVVFFDPQYRGGLNKLAYGNEGKSRGKARAELPQMEEPTIIDFISKIDRILKPSGHLFLWVDKFHLCEGVKDWLLDTSLEIVDMLTWDKGIMGMGYRTRRQSEYCIIIQKLPKKAKAVWTVHNIPDVIQEKVGRKKGEHPHRKPIELQKRLIEATTVEGDIVIDPAAGSYSVMAAANAINRDFFGCDLL